MEIINVDEGNRVITLKINSLNDLFWLPEYLRKGVKIKTRVKRRIKHESLRMKDTRRVSIVTKISVEEVTYLPDGKIKVKGKIVEAPEKYGIQGKYQSTYINVGSTLTLENLKMEDIRKISKISEDTKASPMLIIAIDDEIASLFEVENSKIHEKCTVRSYIHGKQIEIRDRKTILNKYFSEISNIIINSIQTKNYDWILIIGPGFTKNDFYNYISSKHKGLNGKIRVYNAGSASKSAIYEIVGRKILDNLVLKSAALTAISKVNEFVKEVSRGSGLAAYGTEEVTKAGRYGALKWIGITTKYLFKAYNSGLLEELKEVIKRNSCKLDVLDSSSSLGLTIDSFGGIIAILRFRLI